MFALKNGLAIDAENPVMHDYPSYCYNCNCWYYFNHACIESTSQSFRRGQLGYFDGSKEERDEQEK